MFCPEKIFIFFLAILKRHLIIHKSKLLFICSTPPLGIKSSDLRSFIFAQDALSFLPAFTELFIFQKINLKNMTVEHAQVIEN